MALGATTPPSPRLCLFCMSGQWDRLYAAFTIANGALAIGQEVDIFFAFWAASTMQSASGTRRRGLLGRLMGLMMPSSVGAAPMSHLHFGGLGRRLMSFVMRREGVDDLPVLIKQAEELGARFHYCDTSMRLLGFAAPDPKAVSGEVCGVTTFLSAARGAQVLFI